jgi:predicted MFS family arabinose efflux permease
MEEKRHQSEYRIAPTLPTLLRLFLPFALGYFLSYIFRMVNAVLAPNLVADLGLEPASLGLLTSAYFLSFAAFQVPLGVLLDRFGPRRVEAVLLLFAAAGAFLFSRAESLAALICARALIGLGVSACLMAAFKAFTQWLPLRQLPLANGIQMVSGGMGALFATAPVEAALQVTDWRGVFLGLSVLTLAAAVVVFVVVPRHYEEPSGESLREQLRGVATIYTSQKFWRIAPWGVFAQTAFLSIPGLWAGPWLRDVAGFDRDGVASTLLWLAMAMIAGYFFFGLLTERLARRGIPPLTVAAAALTVFAATQVLLLSGTPLPPVVLLPLFGFAGTACILPYAVLSQCFPRRLAGRANTALNLPVFLGAFAVQWGVGAIIGLWPQAADGGYAPAGYQAGFGLVLLLQVLGAAWFALAGRQGRA